MEIQIKMPMEQIRKLVRDAEKSLEQRSEVRRKLSEKLYLLVKRDFLRKSLGQRGDDGIQWKPIKADTAKKKGTRVIGIDTWDLLESLTVSTRQGGADAVASFESDHAEFFDRERKLLPETPPDPWMQAMQVEVVEPWAVKQIQAVFDKAG